MEKWKNVPTKETQKWLQASSRSLHCEFHRLNKNNNMTKLKASLTRWFTKLIEFVFTLQPLEFTASFVAFTYLMGFYIEMVFVVGNVRVNRAGKRPCANIFIENNVKIPTNRWISWVNYIDGSIVRDKC